MSVYVTPEQAAELESLDRRGQAWYAEMRAEGVEHEQAYRDAYHAYGRRRVDVGRAKWRQGHVVL